MQRAELKGRQVYPWCRSWLHIWWKSELDAIRFVLVYVLFFRTESVHGSGMNGKQTRWLVACVLIVYTAILVKFVVFKSIPTIRIGHMMFRLAGTHTGPGNFVPFRTIVPLLIGGGNHLIAMVNLIGNIVPFMPVGLLTPLVFRSISWQNAIALGILTGLTFEVMEVVFHVGIFDIDDVILNAFGVALGYGVFSIWKRRAQPQPA